MGVISYDGLVKQRDRLSVLDGLYEKVNRFGRFWIFGFFGSVLLSIVAAVMGAGVLLMELSVGLIFVMLLVGVCGYLFERWVDSEFSYADFDRRDAECRFVRECRVNGFTQANSSSALVFVRESMGSSVESEMVLDDGEQVVRVGVVPDGSNGLRFSVEVEVEVSESSRLVSALGRFIRSF